MRELGICRPWQATKEMSSKAAAQQQRPHESRVNASTHFCASAVEINTNQSRPDDSQRHRGVQYLLWKEDETDPFTKRVYILSVKCSRLTFLTLKI